MIPIADLHGDLLCYLEAKANRHAHDPAARCAIPQLKAGGVKWQILPVFTETGPLSVQKGMEQISIYQRLPTQYPQDVSFIQNSLTDILSTDLVGLCVAFENASGFCSEQESLGQGLKRLHSIIQQVGKPVYISLTWNSENRFGGGSSTSIGLKTDGKLLLEELHGKHIAVDLSHASDALAYEMIDYIENKRLAIPLMASHSNARAVKDVPRNLPDELAKEIFRRQGLVGLNLYAPFVGEEEEAILKHLAHWLELGGEKAICLGADFFYDGDFPSIRQRGIKEPFFRSYPNAASYPALIEFVRRELKLGDDLITQWAYKNVLDKS